MNSNLQASDPHNPISARKLVARYNGDFDTESTTNLIVESISAMSCLRIVQESPAGVRSISLVPQFVDTVRDEIIAVGAQWNFEVQAYDDKESLTKQLPLFLELLEEQLAKLPVGQRLEVVVGVSNHQPHSRLSVEASGLSNLSKTNHSPKP